MGAPTKRLFKVAMLDPSLEFIGSWGMCGDLGLPIVIKEFSLDDHEGPCKLCARAQSGDDMPSRTLQLVWTFHPMGVL
ncbi:hypothetical protein Tco_0442686 [Tanacetum coccineum]